jgi:hypothetical protein
MNFSVQHEQKEQRSFVTRRHRCGTVLILMSLAIAAPAPAATAMAPAATKSPTMPALSAVPVVPIATLKPDLAIKSIATNGSCQIVVTVVNSGPGSVPDTVWTTKAPTASGVYLTVSGAGWGGSTIWNFDPGKSLQPSGGSATYTSTYVVKGTVTVMATVDQTSQVTESNEGNNSATASLTCSTKAFQPAAIKAPAAVTPALPGTKLGLGSGTPPDDKSGAETGAESPYYETPAGGATMQAMPGGGTSLLAAGLPPPPQNLPPAPPKESKAIEPAELVVVSSNIGEAQQLAVAAQALGLSIKRRSNLGGLGFVVTVFRVPKDVGVGNALIRLRQSMPNAWADANHRFNLMGDDSHTFGTRLIGWRNNTSCGAGFRVGLIDTPLDTDHPQLRGRSIQSRSFLPGGINPAANDHGTAVASLLIGRESGLLPGAQLYAANVFRGQDKASDTTAEWVVQALNWMVESQVAIINLSLGGPRNLLVEAAVQRLQERGVAVVAAAGNGGVDAPPVFPAAQSGVVAVTAVDANLMPYRNASRGDYIAFAAPGVDVWCATPGGNGAFLSGTSYATPYVTAALVSSRTNAKTPWSTVVHQLEGKARDLGDKGRDPTFGWGLVQTAGCPVRSLR